MFSAILFLSLQCQLCDQIREFISYILTVIIYHYYFILAFIYYVEKSNHKILHKT